ncbi:MAG: glycoside hydrolase, partial [Bacteroidales bacterium]|nr:glycoside hydrolase [Bacteroidales bacterium]
GIIFQDRGGVGRVLTLSPCRWIDGWPMIGDEDGKVPQSVRPYRSNQPEKNIVLGDDFSATKLGLHWQWNHNPINNAWSLSERPGFLRLKTSRVVQNLFLAPNTITQRMEGPTCSGVVKLDLSKMKDGDCAGFSAFNGNSGVLTVKKIGKKLVLENTEEIVALDERTKAVTNVEKKTVNTTELKQNEIWLRIDGDFRAKSGSQGGDIATFYYSLDGNNWTKTLENYKMIFDYRRFFMGSKFAIFNYATKKAGVMVDVDFFEYKKGEK